MHAHMVLYGNRVSPVTRFGTRRNRISEVVAKARFRDDEYRCISNAILFLASDEPRYITGVSLPVDAGGLLKQSTTEAEMTNA